MTFELIDLREMDLPFFDEVASNLWVPSQDPRAAPSQNTAIPSRMMMKPKSASQIRSFWNTASMPAASINAPNMMTIVRIGRPTNYRHRPTRTTCSSSRPTKS